MKIDRTGPVRPSTPSKRSEKSGKAQGSSFSQHMTPGPETVSGAVAPSPVSTVDALLSLQEVEDSTTGQSKSRARKWGNDVLDQLEQIRIGIIGGERIAAMVDGKRERTNDPALEMILDEIELRAKVELAKLDRMP